MSAGSAALEVWLDGRVIADLEMSRRQVPELRYRPDFVAERGIGALGVSVPLPVARRPVKGDLVDYWIESLLPEGETRTVLERFFRVRRGDGFALLAAIGRDCAGAVAVTPPGHVLGAATGPLRPLTSAEIGEAVATLRQHPLGVDEEVRVSLGGLQSKLLLVQVDGGWARPLGGMASTHILKPDPPEFPGLVSSEAFAQQAATLAGLSAAEACLGNFGGRTVLVVTRFDRVMKDGRLARRHQEDAAQALGVDPATGKYQSLDGTASYRRLAQVLSTYAIDKAGELRRLGAMLAFTVAIGNTDAHLRNHAFLHDGDALSLAPIYDAAPTAEFASTRQVALWVDNQSLLEIITRSHMVRELVGWGLEPDDAEHVIGATLEKLADAYDEAARMTPEVSPAIVGACQRRTENLLRQSTAS
jgi:serine/threonine-protein kinase HipA